MIAAADPLERRVHVGQGEHYVTDDPHVMLSTILGSCVAMCLRDPGAGIGGMNHFLLPEGEGAGTDAGRRVSPTCMFTRSATSALFGYRTTSMSNVVAYG